MKAMKVNVYTFLMLVMCALLFAACENPLNKQTDTEIPPEMGVLFLTIDSVNTRTVMPESSTDHFAVYKLEFSISGTLSKTMERTNATLSDPVYLSAGTYTLQVTAYTDEEKTKPAAQGSVSVTITTGATTNRTVNLAVISAGGGTGLFTWNITLPAELTAASMKISPRDGATGTPEEMVDLLDENIGERELNTGYYILTSSLSKQGQSIILREILHIYQNLESNYEFEFEDEYFNRSRYTVTFEFNNGVTANSEDYWHGDLVIAPTDPTRTGYIFGGWYKEATLTNPWVFATDTVTANITLYAKWTLNQYTVSFDSDGGSAVSSINNVNHGSTITAPTDPEKTGYTFEGWYKEATCENEWDFDTDTVSANITLYAKWETASGGAGETITSPTGIVLVEILGGTFTMGSPESETGSYSYERPQHQVTLSSFYMGKYEVTQEQYQAVMGTNPSSFTTGADAGEIQSKRPVEMVSWYEALVFCNKLSMLESLDPAYSIGGETDPDEWETVPTSSNATWNGVTIVSGSTGYRLPTEAQWEYACRAGTTTAYNTGDTISDNTGWYDANSNSKTHEVGKKPPNAWGLYDMHGNVYEWCWDWYGNYESEPQSDPTGASSGARRGNRGGSWDAQARYVRSAYRYDNIPSTQNSSLGFRLVRPVN